MKQILLDVIKRIDTLSLRERLMVFGGAVATVVFVLYFFMLNPLIAKQSLLRDQIEQQRNNIIGINKEIAQTMLAANQDPDLANVKRLDKAKQDVEKLTDSLRAMQKGLVAPDRVVPLLQNILRGNGKLRLVSLKSLPVGGMGDLSLNMNKSAASGPKEMNEAQLMTRLKSDMASAKAQQDAAIKPAVAQEPVVKPSTAPVVKQRELVYRHGVELTLQGNYLDMVNYMGALESMPTQLFWGKASLDASEYPVARLTLILYTLSMDQKWMKL